jgi:microcystin-dependent protein|eukprot:CAMPEP_0174286994 /NCGR_PEP_ID=MMETSP0809-20121228/14008_1 /TAXON_ID=73025 ORGANISM="Eutreptiella gymnastica-like, Strain CCMP1594" /NCGR_SAMPLE_ID=MMETSP0809 /ASSEMBLY_ACC=CAM_ASM_000658 /LENGTH=189 /DNA_ID=CAMNT_0015383313 /DNA_START=20 /DNA_END=589 /DNA_ORIENTATION=-
MNALALCIVLLSALGAHASEPFLGEIRYVGFTFCPRGWTDANGQLLPISQNSALFSLFGTTYGGDGRTTFGLPDLRGRAPIHTGSGPGLTNRRQGQKGGTESETLTVNQIPSHTHTLQASTDGATKAEPAGMLLSEGCRPIYTDQTTNQQALHSSSITNAGGGQDHNNMSPFLTIRACVATVGLFPSRS